MVHPHKGAPFSYNSIEKSLCANMKKEVRYTTIWNWMWETCFLKQQMDISLVVYHWYIHQLFLNAQTISGKFIGGDLDNCGVRTNVYSHALWILYHAWTAHSKEPIDPHRQIKSVTWMIHKTDSRKLTPFSQIPPLVGKNGDWFLTVSVCGLKMVNPSLYLSCESTGFEIRSPDERGLD